MNASVRLLRPCLLVLLLTTAGTARAQEAARAAPEWWGNVNLVSYHLGDEDEFLAAGESFNQENWGAGVELQWQPRHAASAGYYRNSVDEDSWYALYHYTPLQLGRHLRVGGMAGVVTGYPGYNDGGIAPAGGLVAKLEGDRVGMNLIYLPKISNITPNTLALQFKLRLGR
jgi:hypothetical protein